MSCTSANRSLFGSWWLQTSAALSHRGRRVRDNAGHPPAELQPRTPLTAKVLRRVRGPLGLRLLLAVALIVAGTVLLPRAWALRPVKHWRAAFHLNRAEAHQKAHETEQTRAEFQAALRLEPGDAAARQKLVDLELSAGNWELAF